MKVGNLPSEINVVIRFSYVMELNTSADGDVIFVLPSVLVPRYGGDINNEPFLYKQEGLVVDSGDLSYTLAFTATIERNSSVEKVSSPTDSLRPLNMDGHSEVVKVVLGKPLSRKCDTRMNIVYKEPFKPQILWEAGDKDRGGMLKQDVFMLNFLPQLRDADFSSKQEFIFLIDRSGSMSGSKMKNAKETLLLFLKSLPAECYFNIVSFGSDYKFLFKGGSVEYNEENLAEAEKCQRRMSADMGGTEIYRALKQIYSRPPFAGFDRQLFLITDGEVFDTKEVIRLVKKNSVHTRMFSIGIGEGASTSLVRGSARAGRGQAEFVTGNDRLQTKVMKILKLAMQASVQDLSLDWTGVNLCEDSTVAKKLTIVPQPIPPLFHGNRLVLYALFEDLDNLPTGKCALKCHIGGTEMVFELDLDSMEKVDGKELSLHRLAAKAQIKHLEDEVSEESRSNRDKVNHLKSLITMFSTSANVISSETAFVGFDRARQVAAPMMEKIKKKIKENSLSPVKKITADKIVFEAKERIHTAKGIQQQPMELSPASDDLVMSSSGSDDIEDDSEDDEEFGELDLVHVKRKRRAERFVLDEAEIDDDSDSVSLDEGEEQIEIGRRLLSRSRTRSFERDRRSRSRSRSRSRERSRRSRSRNRSRCRGRRSRSRNRSRCRGRRSRSRNRSRSKDRCFREDEFRVRKRKEKKKSKLGSRSRSRSRSRGSRSMSPTTSSQSKSMKTQRDVLDIVKLQRFSGNWELDDDLGLVLGKDIKTVQDASPVKDMKVWATVVALVWLRMNFMTHHEEWEMIEMKATRWLHKQALDGVTQEELMTAAEKLGLVIQNT